MRLGARGWGVGDWGLAAVVLRAGFLGLWAMDWVLGLVGWRLGGTNAFGYIVCGLCGSRVLKY